MCATVASKCFVRLTARLPAKIAIDPVGAYMTLPARGLKCRIEYHAEKSTMHKLCKIIGPYLY